MNNNGIDITIDEITPCLKRSDGVYIDTHYEKIKPISPETAKQMQKYNRWKFDWSDSSLQDCSIYALYVEDSPITQGLIACRNHKSFKNTQGYIEVVLVEANPLNVGKDGKYKGVGAHLFAIACKLSCDLGYDGYIVFESKTDLMDHYARTLQAKKIINQYMQLDSKASKILIHMYEQKAGNLNE